MSTPATNDIYLVDALLLCVRCRQPIKARINTPNWLRVEWIGPESECLRCHQQVKENRGPEGNQTNLSRA